MKPTEKLPPIAVNRKARFDYFIEDRYEAGMVLQGWEVKSMRAGKAQLTEAYVYIRHGEAFLIGAHMAPLGMKFYTGDQFPADYKNNIILAEHGSWNRHQFQGGRLMRITVDPDGKNAKEVEFAAGWIGADGKYRGRPNDVLVAKDGALMVADDFTGSIYRISYAK